MEVLRLFRKKWNVSLIDKEQAALLAENYSLDPFVSLLLVSRGITDSLEIDEFFSNEVMLCDPFELKDMDKAVVRIREAVEKYEKIAVFGDYDADGVTATALMYSYLSEIGADVVYAVPDRHTEGYGTSREAVDRFASDGVKLIITVDNGIGSADDAEYAKTLGIDMVITDHHTVGEKIPDAVAVINPHRSDCMSHFKEWAGVGVAFKLISALDGDGEKILARYADIIAIGTLADVVSLTGENRVIVKQGLEKINSAPCVGIEAIKQAANTQTKTLSAMSVAFTVAPRINAAGRMGSAMRAIKLILSDNEDEARLTASEINSANAERQSVEADITAQAIEKIEKNGYKYQKVIVVDGENWHSGVIGIVAARLVDRYGKPAVVITRMGENAHGSARSLDGFSLYDAFSYCEDTLTSFGGHTLAAGMGTSCEKIDAFRQKINRYADTIEMPFPFLTLDCKLNPSYITTDLANLLSVLEPFGCGNNQPVFGLFGMKLDSVKPIGDGRHIRLSLSKNGNSVSAVKFGVTAAQFPFKAGDRVDAAVKIEKNEFHGEERVSVQVRDMRFSDSDEEKRVSAIRLYERFMRSEELNDDEISGISPDRDFLAQVYRFIKNNDGWRFDSEVLAYRMGLDANLFAKLLVSLDVMSELKIINENDDGTYSLPEVSSKVELSSSLILQRLERRA